jgi:hypothetical protein
VGERATFNTPFLIKVASSRPLFNLKRFSQGRVFLAPSFITSYFKGAAEDFLATTS